MTNVWSTHLKVHSLKSSSGWFGPVVDQAGGSNQVVFIAKLNYAKDFMLCVHLGRFKIETYKQTACRYTNP